MGGISPTAGGLLILGSSAKAALIFSSLSTHLCIKKKCEQCDYKFTKKNNLRQHVKAVHEAIKHQCEYCSHKASTPNNLRQHVKSLHVGIKYHCDYCNYKSVHERMGVSNTPGHFQRTI